MKTHRYKLLADALNLSINQFEKEIGVGTSRISKAISKDYGVTTDIIFKIRSKYPNVSEEWLRDGTGDMFNKQTTITPTDYTKKDKQGGKVRKWIFEMRDELYQKIHDIGYSERDIAREIEEVEEELEFLKQLAAEKKKGK